jgi:hypothetical protein
MRYCAAPTSLFQVSLTEVADMTAALGSVTPFGGSVVVSIAPLSGGISLNRTGAEEPFAFSDRIW